MHYLYKPFFQYMLYVTKVHINSFLTLLNNSFSLFSHIFYWQEEKKEDINEIALSIGGF